MAGRCGGLRARGSRDTARGRALYQSRRTYDVRITDAEGKVTAPGLDPRRPLDVVVAPPPERKDLRSTRLLAWLLKDTTVAVGPGSVVGGTVLDASGRPVPAWEVHLVGTDGERDMERTDDEGRFLFDDVAIGQAVLTVQSAGEPRSHAVSLRVRSGTKHTVLVVE